MLKREGPMASERCQPIAGMYLTLNDAHVDTMAPRRQHRSASLAWLRVTAWFVLLGAMAYGALWFVRMAANS